MVKVVRNRRGVRLVEGPDVVSHLRATPGTTHGFFDFLAGCVAAFVTPTAKRRPRLALLGFAAGGVLAPLRALGWKYRVDAVDLSHDAVPMFREIAGAWAGDVRVAHEDAATWLHRSRTRWDGIVEDLAVRGRSCAVKPEVSVVVLPELMQARLAPRGVIITNVLPVPGWSWSDLLERLATPHDRTLVVHCDEYENRILLAGAELPPARPATAALRAA